MATNNIINVGLSGQTGTGAFAGSNSPIFTTPTLGEALATSVNFGQTSLNYYEEGLFTPTFTFQTPGDLSVVYTIQDGVYTRFGNAILIRFGCDFTPTFTTSTGTARFGGLPFIVLNPFTMAGAIQSFTPSIIWPASTTMVAPVASANQSYYLLRAFASAAGNTNFTVSNFTSGAITSVYFTGHYFI